MSKVGCYYYLQKAKLLEIRTLHMTYIIELSTFLTGCILGFILTPLYSYKHN